MPAKAPRRTRASSKAGRPGGAVTILPATPDRWDDLVRCFGARGAYDGCWCMYFKQDTAAYQAGRGPRNREAMREIVAAGRVPGLLAYDGDEPVGWCAVEPRSEYVRLGRSRVTRAVDEAEVWSITCFFVKASHRGRGLTRALIDAACEHARRGGAILVEAYPVDAAERGRDSALYHGRASTFLAAGFVEVARHYDARPIVRRRLTRS